MLVKRKSHCHPNNQSIETENFALFPISNRSMEISASRKNTIDALRRIMSIFFHRRPETLFAFLWFDSRDSWG